MEGLKGLDKVVQNLNREITAIKGRTIQGLIKSAALIRRDMDSTPPVIPVKTGNLRGSWFTEPGEQKGNPVLTIGFHTDYGVYVHEMVGPTSTGKKINWSRPGSGPKFLEAPLKRNTKQILNIIAEEARIKK